MQQGVYICLPYRRPACCLTPLAHLRFCSEHLYSFKSNSTGGRRGRGGGGPQGRGNRSDQGDRGGPTHAPEGGCLQPCEYRLSCGHVCRSTVCHFPFTLCVH